MTIKELYEFGIKNNLVDAQIMFRQTKDPDIGDYYVADAMTEKEEFMKNFSESDMPFFITYGDYPSDQKFVILEAW